jgi:hypothetical protein
MAFIAHPAQQLAIQTGQPFVFREHPQGRDRWVPVP